jgi:hypothetical protein
MRAMNRKLRQMTIEKIKFQHRCIEVKEEPIEADNQNLSAFEKFKLTPAYREILKKQGKLVEDTPDKKEPELKNEPNSESQSP